MTTLQQALVGGSGAAVAQRGRNFLSHHIEGSQLPPLSKKMYNSLSTAISSELKSRHFPAVCDLINCLSLCLTHSTTQLYDVIQSLLAFGLGRKMVEWLASLRSMPCTGSMGWRQACIVMATTVEEVLEGSDKSRLLLLTTPLLEWVCLRELPVEARLSSARCLANLLEIMKTDHKTQLTRKHSHLFDQMMDGLSSAGDYDLQATMVECCICALGESSGRSDYAHHWFSDYTLITAFINIQESTFEMDCREFLTLLNSTAAHHRSVHSFLCKTALLGATQLHPPSDVGLRGFWLDINSASLSLSLNVDDPATGGVALWENVCVSDKLLQSWSISTHKGDVVLSLVLTTPSHTLLPTLPSSHHHSLTITFSPSHNPTLAMETLFPGKMTTPTNQPSVIHTGPPLSPTLSVKSSIAVTPLHIRQTESQQPATGNTSRQSQQPATGNTSRQSRQSATGNTSRQSRQPATGNTSRQSQQSATGNTSRQSQQPATGNTSRQSQQPATGNTSRQSQQPATGKTSRLVEAGQPAVKTTASCPSQPAPLPHVSPIDIPPNTPVQGGQVNSQGSTTPTSRCIPCPTPQTSTPKHPESRLSTPATGVRPALQFSSDGGSKRSVSISSIHLTTQSATSHQSTTTTPHRPARTPGNTLRLTEHQMRVNKPVQCNRPSDKDELQKTTTAAVKTVSGNQSVKKSSKHVKTVLKDVKTVSKNVKTVSTGKKPAASKKSLKIGRKKETRENTVVECNKSETTGKKTVIRHLSGPQSGPVIENETEIDSGISRDMADKPHPPVCDITNKPHPPKRGLSDITNSLRVKEGRITKPRATQRKFVLSHAPMIGGGGVARGKGRPKGGVRGEISTDQRNNLVRAFDFRDSPASGKRSPPTIPSSLPSPTAIPDSIPHHQPPPTTSHSEVHSSSVVLHSTPDSDHDSDHTWNGDTSDVRDTGMGPADARSSNPTARAASTETAGTSGRRCTESRAKNLLTTMRAGPHKKISGNNETRTGRGAGKMSTSGAHNRATGTASGLVTGKMTDMTTVVTSKRTASKTTGDRASDQAVTSDVNKTQQRGDRQGRRGQDGKRGGRPRATREDSSVTDVRVKRAVMSEKMREETAQLTVMSEKRPRVERLAGENDVLKRREKTDDHETLMKRPCVGDDDVIEGRGLQSPTVSTLTSSPAGRQRRKRRLTPPPAAVLSPTVSPTVDTTSSTMSSPKRGRRGTKTESPHVPHTDRGPHGSTHRNQSPPTKKPRTSSNRQKRSQVIHEATPPAPSSPPSSINSSDVGPDLSITTGFEKICQSLVARARDQMEPPSHGSQPATQSTSDGQRSTLSGERSGDQQSQQMTSVTPVEEQLPHDVMNIRSGPGEFPSMMMSLLGRKHSRKRKAIDQRKREEVGVATSPVAMVKRQPVVAKKPVRKKPRAGCDRDAVTGLHGVWQNQELERNDVLYAHNDKMMKCLVSMESALNGSWDLTEGLLQSMRETLSFMTNETTSAANWLEKLHDELSTFHTTLGDMEQRQGQQRGVAQHSLGREMMTLQHKTIQETHKAQVNKMRQALQTMLMKL